MDKKLLTPGPLTTSMSTKEAMLHDWGSRDQKFIDLNQSIRDSLIKLIDGEGNYQCVPMQGSGTFAVESMISSLTPKDANILISLDVDALDPSIVPGVIGRTPGGLTYYQTLDLIKGAAHQGNICGVNVVEFMPELDIDGIGALNVSRLIAATLGILSRQEYRKI